VTFWQTLIITAIPTGAAVITAIVGIRDLGVRRRLETSKQFLTLFALAHGRPIDGRDGVGVGEQVATVQLIADFARREKLLRGAASGGLSYLAGWDEDEPYTAATGITSRGGRRGGGWTSSRASKEQCRGETCCSDRSSQGAGDTQGPCPSIGLGALDRGERPMDWPTT